MLPRSVRIALRRLLPERLDQRLRAWRFSVQNSGFSPYTAEFEAFGTSHRFYIGDRVGEQWFNAGWDWGEIDYLHSQVVRPGDIVLECGAHHGEMTLLFGSWVGPGGRVIAFDPVRRNCEIIVENARLNDLRNVHVEHAAVGAEEGTTIITEESNARVVGDAGVGTPVTVTTVDAHAHLCPTVLKIDVEGFEAEVLRGATDVLRTRPRLAIELHPNVLPRYGASVEDVLAHLRPHDYALHYRFKGETEVRPYDGAPIKDEAHLFAFPR